MEPHSIGRTCTCTMGSAMMEVVHIDMKSADGVGVVWRPSTGLLAQGFMTCDMADTAWGYTCTRASTASVEWGS